MVRRRHLEIPPREFWPVGYDGGDYVSGFFDTWRGVDLRAAAWWHDLRYWLGYFVPVPIQACPRCEGAGFVRAGPIDDDRCSLCEGTQLDWTSIRAARPRPRSERNWRQRLSIDRHFRVDVRELGLTRAERAVAYKIVRVLGRDVYYNGGPDAADSR